MTTFPEHARVHAPASRWVSRWLGVAAAAAARPLAVLDFAAGSGRHARLAAAQGHHVVAVDRDAAALSTLADDAVECVVCDLEHMPWPFAARRFDVVICCNYLDRARWEPMAALLAPGGWLVHETFALGNARFGRPSNPDHLLRPGELLQRAAAAALQVVAFEQGVTGPPRQAAVQRLCVRHVPDGTMSGRGDGADAPLG